jgi:crotonobetainyl-CoA:carnitine CoA-transferase CaiB-like acyl-CoA transferase
MKTNHNAQSPGALHGIKIVDLSIQIPGPYCSMILGDLGAEVTKIEQPGIGDFARALPHLFNGINRNKKSVILELKSPKGKEILYKLVAHADIVLEGFRPGVAKKLGIDYARLKGINPRIIYCSISGYGQDGPYKNISGHDINYQGVAGLLSLTEDLQAGADLSGLPLADIAGSMFAAISILTAIVDRAKTGRGQYIDVSMAAGVFSWAGASLFTALKEPNNSESLYIPHYGIFQTKDDEFITLGIMHEQHFWENLCAVIDLGEMRNLNLMERIARREEILSALQSAFKTKTREEWISLLHEADVPCGPVLTIEESFSDPQIMHRQMVFEMDHPVEGTIKQRAFPARFSDTELKRDMPPPLYGQHTDEILTGLGYTRDDIKKLREEKVVA